MSANFDSPAVAPAPAANIAINLDELEKEDRPDPFIFVHKGRSIRMIDPVDLGWQTIDRLQNERDFLVEAMTEEDAKWFLSPENDMPGWKMERLGRLYQEHYRVDDASGKGA